MTDEAQCSECEGKGWFWGYDDMGGRFEAWCIHCDGTTPELRALRAEVARWKEARDSWKAEADKNRDALDSSMTREADACAEVEALQQERDEAAKKAGR